MSKRDSFNRKQKEGKKRNRSYDINSAFYMKCLKELAVFSQIAGKEGVAESVYSLNGSELPPTALCSGH